MRISLSVILFACLALPANLLAQDFQTQFHDAFQASDSTATLNILHNWKIAKPGDPELYIAYFNFYAKKSMTAILNLSSAQSGDKSLVITDPKTNKAVGYLNDGQTINITVLSKGFKYIDTAIEKYPSRLDMRFGEIYMLGKIPDYDKFTAKLVATIEYSDKIKAQWLWANGKPVEEPVKFMLDAEQTYIMQLYDAGDAELDNMRLVAETALKYYPNSVENLSNLAITYMVRKNCSQALELLLKANKIASTDYIVINNIAYCYKALNDKRNAIKYYRLAEIYGDDDSKAFAKKQLEELEK